MIDTTDDITTIAEAAGWLKMYVSAPTMVCVPGLPVVRVTDYERGKSDTILFAAYASEWARRKWKVVDHGTFVLVTSIGADGGHGKCRSHDGTALGSAEATIAAIAEMVRSEATKGGE